MVLLQRKLYFSTDRGPTFFRGGGGGGGGGGLISIETHITSLVIFQGVRAPYHPSGSTHGLIVGYLYLTTCENYSVSILLPWTCHNGTLCPIFLLLSGILDIRKKKWRYLLVHKGYLPVYFKEYCYPPPPPL